MDPEWLPKNAVVCPGYISFIYFEDDRKKMHVHPRSLDKCHLKLSFLFVNLWRRQGRRVVFLSALKLGDIFILYLTKIVQYALFDYHVIQFLCQNRIYTPQPIELNTYNHFFTTVSFTGFQK